MKDLFRKYFQSVLRSDEFSAITDFLADKKNDSSISELIKPYWDKEMNNDNEMLKPNADVKNKILNTILVEESKSMQRKLQLYKWSLRIAAVFVLGLFVTAAIFFSRPSEKNIAFEQQTITTPYGAKTSLTLPDGSLVWLNSGSTLAFDTQFKEKRQVKLTGEAFFEVKKNGKPFNVLTSYGEVQVKGTVFNVTAYHGESFQTTLVSGLVTVKEKYKNQEVNLHPGQQAGLYGKVLEVHDVDTELFSSWKDGKLIFRNEYLPMVTRRLERWYNVKIELAADKHLSEISYTGTLEMESFSEVLQLLKVTAPIDYSYNEKSRTIKIVYRNN